MAKVHDSATDLITFARGSSATYTGSDGTQQTAASDEPRIEYAADGSLKGLLIEEQRTNLLLNSDNPDTQVATLAAGSHTLSFVGGPSVTGISDTITANAVDVFVYDTSKDSDGGAWRTGSLAQASSWYAEASSASREPTTRSTRAEFPAVAVIVAESNKVTIYDGDDPSLPMWMVFETTNKGIWITGITGLVAKNGEMSVSGIGPSYFGWSSVNFVSEVFRFATNSGQRVLSNTLAQRNSASAIASTDASKGIASSYANDVAMTVLPGAPTDPATGLPVPTIAVATDGGVSVIKDDGTVVDITGQTQAILHVSFNSDEELITTGNYQDQCFVYSLPPSDIANDNSTYRKRFYTIVSTPALMGGVANDLINAHVASNEGLTRFAESPTTPANGMVAYTTSDYTTGWMPGDIKLAALANSATADRSVNNNPLTQNGTITAAPVETGADLVAYSGFSSSNYLEQPYNPDLDFGTGDFCVMGWVKQSSISASQIILAKANAAATSVFSFFTSASTGYLGYFHPTSGSVSSSKALALNAWNHIGLVRSIGLVTFYVNGVAAYSSTPTAFDLTRTNDDILRVGKDFSVNTASTSSMSLLRISATAPTADQIAKIYNDEKVLFQENAKATLTGSSDAVTALAHDPDTNLLHVGTSGGRSVFYGLRRVNETATAVTTAISAVDGLIVEQ